MIKLIPFVLGNIALLIQQYADHYQQEDLSKSLTELGLDLGLPRIRNFDFIIVGGGTAGCLMAARLSERYRVLLLEKGGTPVPLTQNLYFTKNVSDHPAITSYYPSLPQEQFNMENGGASAAYIPKMLGGSSSNGECTYNRGNPADYDYIANVTGDETWAYSHAIKHFKRIENYVGMLITEKERAEYYGVGGPLTVETVQDPILQSWFQAGRELGFNVSDPNGRQTEGFTPMGKTMRNGERESSYTAYLKGIESSRSSLLILRYCEVDMILINMGNVAYGVRYKRHGIPQIAHVTKEIIVSSGVISSPLLLMKSGIGPRTQLTKGGIPTKVDSIGVGQNLHNHGGVTLLFSVNNPKLELLPKVEKRAFEEDLGRYHDSIWRHGFFARVDFGPQAFIVSGRAKGEGEANHPDLQIIYRLKPLLGDGQLEIQLHVIITRMKSVGSVGFNSTSHFEGEEDDTKLAIIDDKLFTDSTDVDVLIEGIKLAIKIMEETTPFQAMKLSYNENPPELCKSLPPRSDEYWKCYVKQRAVPWWRMAGTCKMGKELDPMAVLDSKLRVKGVKKLRVVDASALPRTPNSGIFAATLMLAEKTVQEIFKEHVSEMTPPAVIPQPQQLEPSL